jgi:hypothetical protein
MLFVRFNLAVLVNEVRAGDGRPTHIAGAEGINSFAKFQHALGTDLGDWGENQNNSANYFRYLLL